MLYYEDTAEEDEHTVHTGAIRSCHFIVDIVTPSNASWNLLRRVCIATKVSNHNTCNQPHSLIFFGVFLSENDSTRAFLLSGSSKCALRSDSHPGASSPVILRCITTIPALSSSSASILWDFSFSSLDKSIWHLKVNRTYLKPDNAFKHTSEVDCTRILQNRSFRGLFIEITDYTNYAKQCRVESKTK